MELVKLSEVINEIERFKGYLDDDMILRIKIAINRLPTIEPTKHAHWVIKPNGHGVCSNCAVCDVDVEGGVDSNYCPNCGAAMDETI